MSEVDPDPYEPGEGEGKSQLGGHPVPQAGDPTDGGKHGGIGAVPSITADEPDDGSTYPVGGGSVQEETNTPPVAGSGPGA